MLLTFVPHSVSVLLLAHMSVLVRAQLCVAFLIPLSVPLSVLQSV